jgi:LytS/YehU family sensor histidine kinase
MLMADRNKRKEQGPLEADRLRIVIRNSGRRVEGEHAKNGNGVGLENAEGRLKTLYGTDFEFSLAWLEMGGCEAVLELPFRWAPHLQKASLCGL